MKTAAGTRWRAARPAFPMRLAIAGLLLLSGCAAPVPDPDGSFALEQFFDGTARSSGTVDTLLVWREKLRADFAGTTTGRRLDLDETFHFPKGDRLQRWQLTAEPGGRYAGTVRTAGDDGQLRPPVPVTGYRTTEGAVLDYDGYAPGGSDMRLHFRHWMTRQADGTVLNRVRISKFSLPLASATVVFTRLPPAG